MKILIIKPSSLGDIIQSNPTLVVLKEAYPDAAITWLVFDAFADILPLFADLDRIMVWNKKGGMKEYLRVMGAIRKERFDLVIDLQGLARTAVLAFLSGAAKKIGVPGMKELSWILVKQAFPESRGLNAAARALETVRYLTGKKPGCAFNLRIPAAIEEYAREILARHKATGRERVVALIPMARGSHKVWPAEHYRELVGLLIEDAPDTKIFILGALEDVRRIRHSAAIDISGRTSLQQMAGILSKCDVVIGGDTGPVHLASALGVPLIAVFGGSDVRETSPIAANAVILKKDFPCSPCRGHATCNDMACLSAITAQEVFAAAKAIMCS
jgi:lipopolysaccharide heptosyltransferase I